MKNKYFILLFALSLFITAAETQAACWEGSVQEIFDGNTLIVNRPDAQFRVRLYGIEAPSQRQPFGVEAKNKLNAMLLNQKVTVCPKKMPGAPAAEVHVLMGYKLNVNREMLRLGLARSTVDQYRSFEALARKKRLGIWSQDNPVLQQQSPRVPTQPYTNQHVSVQPGEVYGDSSSGGFTDPGVSPSLPQADSASTNAAQAEPAAISRQRERELETIRVRNRMHNSNENLDVTDVDLVLIRTNFENAGYRSDGILDISFDYRNRTQGRDVYWTEGAVNCDCRVTGHFNNGTNTSIARESTILNSHAEHVYIDIPKRYLNDSFIELYAGTVECDISSGVFSIKASDRFYVYYP